MIPLGILSSSVRRASAMLLAPTNLVATLVEPTPTPLPTVIGEGYGGGYYIGDLEIPDADVPGVYAIIMGGAESQAPTGLAWKSVRSSTPGSESPTDGLGNTLAMQAVNPATHHAGMYCLGYGGGGFVDWYMPAKDELNLAWVNLEHLGALAIEVEQYWSSTQSPTDSSIFALFQWFGNGGQNPNFKDALGLVRPIRRILRTAL